MANQPVVVPDSERLLKPADVAARLGITGRSLQQYRSDGTGPQYIYLGPRCVRYDPDDVAAYLKSRKRTKSAGVHRAAPTAKKAEG